MCTFSVGIKIHIISKLNYLYLYYIINLSKVSYVIPSFTQQPIKKKIAFGTSAWNNGCIWLFRSVVQRCHESDSDPLFVTFYYCDCNLPLSSHADTCLHTFCVILYCKEIVYSKVCDMSSQTHHHQFSGSDMKHLFSLIFILTAVRVWCWFVFGHISHLPRRLLGCVPYMGFYGDRAETNDSPGILTHCDAHSNKLISVNCFRAATVVSSLSDDVQIGNEHQQTERSMFDLVTENFTARLIDKHRRLFV